MKLTRLVPLYAALVLGLAAMGALNQSRYRYQSDLIDEKAALHERIVELRSQVASVRGPLAVGVWARERGMIPTPEVDDVIHVAYLPAPLPQETYTGLEVRTIWR